jgi:replication-associated recombination protein RarA
MPRAAFYMPPATISPKRLEQDIALLRWEVQSLCDAGSSGQAMALPLSGFIRPDQLELLIIDEVNRLDSDELEVLRDVFERGQMGMVLIGRPGIDRKVRAVPPLAGRVGMRYVFEGLQEQEVLQLLQQYVQGRAVEMTPLVASAIIERAKGSFQKVRLLLLQIEYLLGINELSEVTMGVVDLACEQVY